MQRLRVFACALALAICAGFFVAPLAAAQDNSSDFYARPQGADDGVVIPTLFHGSRANRNDNTRYASDASCVRHYLLNTGGVVQVLSRPLPVGGFGARATGFFISRDGMVAACNHELAYWQGQVKIVTADSATYSVKVLLQDESDDICILKVKDSKAGPFQALNLGSSDQLTDPGQELVAFGYPQGWGRLFMSPGTLEGTRPAGLFLDALKRPIPFLDPRRRMLKIYMHCEPGNSGSPVMDYQGQVVGIVDGNTNDGKTTLATPIETLLKDLKLLH